MTATPEGTDSPTAGGVGEQGDDLGCKCHRTDACAQCRVRRDEHADQPHQSAFPALDITDHSFVEEPEGYPEHYADYGCGAWEPVTRPGSEEAR